MFGKFGNSTSKVSREKISLKLGKMSFHGNRGYCLGAQNFYSWVRSRPSKGFYHKNSPATYNSKRYKKFLRTCWFLQEIHKRTSQKSLDHYADCWKKNAKFDFDESCKAAFDEIKSRLVTASILVTLDWNKEFEIMCDASDYAMGVVLG